MTNSELTPLSAVRPEQPRLHKSVTLASIIGHVLVQLASIGVVATAWWFGKVESTAALTMISLIGGWSAGQAVKKRPPTALVIGLYDGLRHVADKHLS